MIRKYAIIVVSACSIVSAVVAKPQDNDNKQDKHTGWFGFGGNKPGKGNGPVPADMPVHGAPVTIPGDQWNGGPPPNYPDSTKFSGPGSPASPRQTIYPGLTNGVRKSPRMPSSNTIDPTFSSGNGPMFGESRPNYEMRMQGMRAGKSDHLKSKSPDDSDANDKTEPNAAPTRRAITPPVPTSNVPNMDNYPAQNKIRSRLDGLYASPPANAQPPVDMKKVQVDFQSTRDKMQKMLDAHDYDGVQREALQLQDRVNQLKSNSSEMPPTDKYNLMNMSHLAGEAAQNLKEGSSSQQDEMIKIGIQGLGSAADASQPESAVPVNAKPKK